MSGRNVPNYRVLTARFASSSQWERTLETAREWLSVEPENTEAHMAAGQALVYLDRHSEAERHIAMVLAALLVEFLFQALGLIPSQRSAQIVETSISLNYTTLLNVIFLAIALLLVIRFFKTGGAKMLAHME